MLLQSHLTCTSWFHRIVVMATSTTYDYHLIVFFFLRLQFHQLTNVPGKENSLLHLIHDSVDPLHADTTSSSTVSGIFIIPWIASISSRLVVPISSYHPIQIFLEILLLHCCSSRSPSFVSLLLFVRPLWLTLSKV